MAPTGRKAPTGRSTEDYKMKYLEEKFDGIYDKLDSVRDHLEIIDPKLTTIETQTTKTNNSVGHLRDDHEELQNTVNEHLEMIDPNTAKIEDLKDEIGTVKEDMLEYNFFKKYPNAMFIIIAIVAALMLISAYGAIQTTINKAQNRNVEKVIENINENTK